MAKRVFPKSKMPTNVFLFIPNLIGYVRIIFALASFYYMPYNPGHAVTFYILSELMDAFDGYAARRFNQGTSFGAVLDMVTDRISTLGLIMVLAMFNSDLIFVYQFLAVLDISSHWFQMYGNLLCGESGHKETKNFFMNLYYSNRIVLFVMCAGNEIFFIATYLQYFSLGPLITILGYEKGLFELMAIMSFPIFLLKQIVSVIQLFTAAQKIAQYDTEKRSQPQQ